MSQHKWQIGPVKLANGDDAFIDVINEGQECNYYTGRARGSDGEWYPIGWRECGQFTYATHSYSRDLAPPPKKKVRVQSWLVVYANGGMCRFDNLHDALVEARALGFALIEIDREVEEGEGL